MIAVQERVPMLQFHGSNSRNGYCALSYCQKANKEEISTGKLKFKTWVLDFFG